MNTLKHAGTYLTLIYFSEMMNIGILQDFTTRCCCSVCASAYVYEILLLLCTGKSLSWKRSWRSSATTWSLLRSPNKKSVILLYTPFTPVAQFTLPIVWFHFKVYKHKFDVWNLFRDESCSVIIFCNLSCLLEIGFISRGSQRLD